MKDKYYGISDEIFSQFGRLLENIIDAYGFDGAILYDIKDDGIHMEITISERG